MVYEDEFNELAEYMNSLFCEPDCIEISFLKQPKTMKV